MGSSRQIVTLGDLGLIKTGKTPSTKVPDHFGGSIPFVTPRDMDGRKRIFGTERYLTEKGTKAVGSAVIPAGSIMVSCIGSDMGKVAIAGRECVTNQQINSIVVSEEYASEYVYYDLIQRKTELRSMASGSAQPILNKGHFSQIEIELPEITEQRAIAHILGSLDDKIELNRRMNQTLEAMARAIFKSWFVDFLPVRAKQHARTQTGDPVRARRGEPLCSPYPGLPDDIAALFPDSFEDSELGEIPKGWSRTTLKDGIDIYDSKRIPLNKRQRAERQGPFPYYGAAGIMDYVDEYLFDGVYVLTGEDGSVADDLGYPVVQYVWGKFWVNNHAHVLKGKNGLCDEHLYLFLQQTDISAFVTGAVQPKLSQANLKAIPFILPDKTICSAFSDLIQPSFQKIRANTDENLTLAALRDTLLPKLISGELRVPDAEKFVEEAV